MIDWKNIE